MNIYKNVIYCLINDINGKQYVGLTINLKKRQGQHKTDYRKYHFNNAVKKYGWEHFHSVVLEEVSHPELLADREIYWIAKLDTYNNGYNSTPGGNYGIVPPVFLKCRMCGKTFRVQLHRKASAHFCSYKCRDKSYGKEYIVFTPKNEIISITNMTNFCRDNDLRLNHMWYVISGKRQQHKGYRAFKIPCILYNRKSKIKSRNKLHG